MTAPSSSGNGRDLFRLQTPALIVGVLATIGLLIGAFTEPDQFFRSYLMGWILLVMISAGSLGLLMMQYLTGGRWGVLIRRPAEAAAGTIPIVGLAFIPLLFGMHSVWEWSHAEVVQHDALIRHKEPYLNASFFTGRAIFFFLFWSVMAFLLVRWSKRLDVHHDRWLELRMRKLSGFGLVALTLTLTFASVDWLMSLEPHWFSTMYGISFVVGCLLSAWAVLTISVVLLSRTAPYGGIVEAQNFRDLGNLMFAFVMLWAYTAFSQFLLIWYGNIREETPYYVVRAHGGWGVIAAALLVFHFFLPFTLLLMRAIKDRPRTLGMVAALMLFMRMVDLFWITAPAFRQGGHGGEAASHEASFHLSWMDPLAFIALLSLWTVLYLRRLAARPLLPEYEPYVKEALGHAS